MNELAGILQTSANSFRDMSAAENGGLFNQCSWLVETHDAITAEFSHIKPSRVRSALLKACGIESGKSPAAMRDRYKVGRIFDGEYAMDCDFSLHVLCASAKGVTIDDPATYSLARGWLDTALAGFMENNVKRKHTTRTLRKVMQDADGNSQTPDKIYLCKGVEARVNAFHDWGEKTTIMLEIPTEYAGNMQERVNILLTMQLPAVVDNLHKTEKAAA